MSYIIASGRAKRKSVRTGISWSDQQHEALCDVSDWLKDGGAQTFYLAGYAGTGKTTLAHEFARRSDGDVVYGAFTGKAASIMRGKGCSGANTINSLIYTPKIHTSCASNPPCKSPCILHCRYKRERFVGRELNPKSVVADASLVIIDEVSMVGEDMGRDLLAFGVPVLVLGDPAQLPPIYGQGYFTRRRPDYLLTEVHRQAYGSPIIELATAVRNREELERGHYGTSAVVDYMSDKDLLEYDQVIVGTHRTRCDMNRRIRKGLGFRGELPEPGEKLICLKNDRNKGLRNGEMFTVKSRKSEANGFVKMVVGEMEDGRTRRIVDVSAPVEAFNMKDGTGGEMQGNPFAFGYTITAHKSQGSQWGSVAVIDESRVFRQDAAKWLYTAITRAVDRVTVWS